MYNHYFSSVRFIRYIALSQRQTPCVHQTASRHAMRHDTYPVSIFRQTTFKESHKSDKHAHDTRTLFRRTRDTFRFHENIHNVSWSEFSKKSIIARDPIHLSRPLTGSKHSRTFLRVDVLSWISCVSSWICCVTSNDHNNKLKNKIFYSLSLSILKR